MRPPRKIKEILMGFPLLFICSTILILTCTFCFIYPNLTQTWILVGMLFAHQPAGILYGLHLTEKSTLFGTLCFLGSTWCFIWSLSCILLGTGVNWSIFLVFLHMGAFLSALWSLDEKGENQEDKAQEELSIERFSGKKPEDGSVLDGNTANKEGLL